MPKRHRNLLCPVLLFASGIVCAGENWRFSLSPYVWFAGQKGHVGTIPSLPTVPVDVSPGDAMEDTEASLMIMLGAMKGQHGLFADLLYSDVSTDEELIPPPIALSMRSTTRTTLFTLAYQYRIHQWEEVTVDVLAGARYWSIDSRLRFGGGTGVLAGRTISNVESWLDPAVGIKGSAPIGNSGFYVVGGIGLGGFGVGSDLFYDVNANIGYRWNKAIGTTFGYRMFDVDYEHHGYAYDVRQEGWQLGLTWSFY